ncbi:putative DNA polymerase zeta catalytic subunit [Blattamonas nauphoetae]|uniref:DNA-directed DNA polymerase n=1 Tax=Blattamonas nauphoetae TaxID=2049346 RepID=A0ABQ9XX89_9EUKA|nr:putative DNA polymerase zeta catalytic subunit [Blattamonas nauphoetae]
MALKPSRREHLYLRVFHIELILSPVSPGYDEEFSYLLTEHLKYAPVFRIFGTSPQGAPICCSVHGFYPYILVPFSLPDTEYFDHQNSLRNIVSFLNGFLLKMVQKTKDSSDTITFYPTKPVIHSPFGKFAHSNSYVHLSPNPSDPPIPPRPILANSHVRLPFLHKESEFITADEKLKATNNRGPWVIHAEFTKGIPFYGYHNEERLFVKLYFCDHSAIKSVVHIIRLHKELFGATNSMPNESHLVPEMQFLIDNNIAGMGILHASSFTVRQPCSASFQHFPQNTIPRQTSGRCTDVDIHVRNIINTHKITRTPLTAESMHTTNYVGTLRTMQKDDEKLRIKIGLPRYEKNPEMERHPVPILFPLEMDGLKQEYGEKMALLEVINAGGFDGKRRKNEDESPAASQEPIDGNDDFQSIFNQASPHLSRALDMTATPNPSQRLSQPTLKKPFKKLELVFGNTEDEVVAEFLRSVKNAQALSVPTEQQKEADKRKSVKQRFENAKQSKMLQYQNQFSPPTTPAISNTQYSAVNTPIRSPFPSQSFEPSARSTVNSQRHSFAFSQQSSQVLSPNDKAVLSKTRKRYTHVGEEQKRQISEENELFSQIINLLNEELQEHERSPLNTQNEQDPESESSLSVGNDESIDQIESESQALLVSTDIQRPSTPPSPDPPHSSVILSSSSAPSSEEDLSPTAKHRPTPRRFKRWLRSHINNSQAFVNGRISLTRQNRSSFHRHTDDVILISDSDSPPQSLSPPSPTISNDFQSISVPLQQPSTPFSNQKYPLLVLPKHVVQSLQAINNQQLKYPFLAQPRRRWDVMKRRWAEGDEMNGTSDVNEDTDTSVRTFVRNQLTLYAEQTKTVPDAMEGSQYQIDEVASVDESEASDVIRVESDEDDEDESNSEEESLLHTQVIHFTSPLTQHRPPLQETTQLPILSGEIRTPSSALPRKHSSALLPSFAAASLSASSTQTESQALAKASNGKENVRVMTISVVVPTPNERSPVPSTDPAVAVTWIVGTDDSREIEEKGVLYIIPNSNQSIDPFEPEAQVDNISFYQQSPVDWERYNMLGRDISTLYATRSETQEPAPLAFSVSTELDFYFALGFIIREMVDPDLIVSWTLCGEGCGCSSSGDPCFTSGIKFLVSRAVYLKIPFRILINRAPSSTDALSAVYACSPKEKTPSGQHKLNQYLSKTEVIGYKEIVGRVVFACWRFMKNQRNLRSYTLSSASSALFNQTLPTLPGPVVTSLYFSTGEFNRLPSLFEVLSHSYRCCELIRAVCCEMRMIGSTSEFARVIGIPFQTVHSRGSQFRVESLLFRLAKPHNFVLPSPSYSDVMRQSLPESPPLILQPISGVRKGPVAVLDFQSLYPSIIIAYNYCFTTCMGRAYTPLRPRQLGVTTLSVADDYFDGVHVNVSPTGLAFVDKSERIGALPVLLNELLQFRVLMKNTMKFTDSPQLAQLYRSRQMAIKYICNVTYGYLGAGYTGRMPCVEIADCVVETGRETLDRAIRFVEKEEGLPVVYGDTDSIFIEFPEGTSIQEVWRRGTEIARRVTQMNPWPMELLMEKVYSPALLVTMKRYCGFVYTSPNQTVPVFESKGLETIRRDQSEATVEVMSRAVVNLLKGEALSNIKTRLVSDLLRIALRITPLHQFIFRKETRQVYRRPASLPPAAAVTTATPWWRTSRGERVGYVVAHPFGEGPVRKTRALPNRPAQLLSKSVQNKRRLSDMSVPPRYLVENPLLRVNVEYYINNQILPPLNRIFCLVGVDVRVWWREKQIKAANAERKKMIQSIFSIQPVVAETRILNPTRVFWLKLTPTELTQASPSFINGSYSTKHAFGIGLGRGNAAITSIFSHTPCACCGKRGVVPYPPFSSKSTHTPLLCVDCAQTEPAPTNHSQPATSRLAAYSLFEQKRIAEARVMRDHQYCAQCYSKWAGNPSFVAASSKIVVHIPNLRMSNKSVVPSSTASQPDLCSCYGTPCNCSGIPCCLEECPHFYSRHSTTHSLSLVNINFNAFGLSADPA